MLLTFSLFNFFLFVSRGDLQVLHVRLETKSHIFLADLWELLIY